MKTNNLILTALTALMLTALAGCSNETELPQDAPDVIPEGVARIEFAIKGVKTGTSYADPAPTVALEENERKINDVTAYLFKLNDGTDVLDNNSVVTDVLPTTLGSNTGKGSFDLGKSTVEAHYAIVFIANKACFNAALADVSKTSNTTYAALNAIETLENTTIMEGLKTDKGLPMRALAIVTVPAGSGKVVIDAKFARPLSRFDIDNQARHSFTVESVVLKNGRKTSPLNVPATANTVATGTVSDISYTSFLSNEINEKLPTPNADGSTTKLRPAFYVSPALSADNASLEITGTLRIGLDYYPRTYTVPLISKDTKAPITLGLNKRYRLTLLLDKDDNIVGEITIDLGEWEDSGNTPDVQPDLDLQVNPDGITAKVTYDAPTRKFDAPIGTKSFQFEMLNDASLSVTTDGLTVIAVTPVEVPVSRGVNATTYEVSLDAPGDGYFIFTADGGKQYRFEINLKEDPTKYPGTSMDAIEAAGLLWAPVNVGAKAVNDPGKLFQFGRLNGWADGATAAATQTFEHITIANSDTPDYAGKFLSRESIPSYWWTDDETTANINAMMARWCAVSDGTNNPCPKGWRLPTKSEAEALLTGQTPTVEVVNADLSKLTVQGVSFTSKEHVLGSATAYVNTDQSVYWLAPTVYENPETIDCTKTTMAVSTINKTSHACSIRCVKTKPVTP